MSKSALYDWHWRKITVRSSRKVLFPFQGEINIYICILRLILISWIFFHRTLKDLFGYHTWGLMDTVFWDGEFLCLGSQGESYISTKLFTYYTLSKLKSRKLLGPKIYFWKLSEQLLYVYRNKDNSMKLQKLDPSEKLRHPKSAVLQHFSEVVQCGILKIAQHLIILLSMISILPLYNLHLVCFAPNSSCVYNTGTSGI